MFNDSDVVRPYAKKLAKWEKRYVALGYKPITLLEWIEIGGYGDKLEKYICKSA
jgi:hypothetical protein